MTEHVRGEMGGEGGCPVTAPGPSFPPRALPAPRSQEGPSAASTDLGRVAQTVLVATQNGRESLV